MKDEKFQNNNAGDERYFSTSDYSQNNDAGWTSDHERSSYDQQFGSNHMDDGHNVLWGYAPEALYHSCMVFGKNSCRIGALVKDQPVYVRVDTFNEGGITEGEVFKLPEK